MYGESLSHMINLQGRWVVVQDKPASGGQQSNFGNVERQGQRIPASQQPTYDYEYRIPGSTEQFDFSYKAPSSQKLNFDFTF